MNLIKKLHKWLSLLVGLQLLIWLASGLYFNLMDHQKASGNEHRVRQQSNVNIDLTRLVEPKVVLAEQAQSISLKQITLLDKPYYLLTHEKGLYSRFKNSYSLIDAYSGEKVMIDKAFAIALAKASYKGNVEAKSAVQLSPPYEDITREKNDVWQVNFADKVNTSVYVDAGSGRLIAHSNDDKRFADFFFMLHFMDYAVLGGDAGFNNVQIIVFSILTLFFAFTGLIWTVELGFNGHYKIAYFAKKKPIKLFDKNNQNIADVTLSNHENILDSLISHDIALPSTCGGGGTCGRCKILVDENVKVTSADFHQFSDQELKQGYRLACQHNSDEIEQLTLVDVTQASKHSLQLVHSEFISPTIKELRFKVVDGHAISFKAGAFMRFFIPAANGVSIPERLPEELKPHWHHIEHLEYEHKACSRSYSLANGDGCLTNGAQELTFAIKIQRAPNKQVIPGVGSSYLCNLKIGQTIDAVGPFEEFYAQPVSSKTLVLLGAGSGMAPLKAMIEEQILLGALNNKKLHFYFGARSTVDLIYRDKLHDLSGEYPNFNYIPVLSQAEPNWHGLTGYVQDQLALALSDIDSLDNIEFYLCGPQAMMTATIALLKKAGVSEQSIFFDSFA
jgi:Na+-transporting NADH:ubiquinone oxidoreductase subunit F